MNRNKHHFRETQLLWRLAHHLQEAGYLVFTAVPARTGRFAAPVHAGFPDLVVLVGDTLHLVELKRARGRVRPEQQQWLQQLAQVRRVRVGVLRAETPEELLAAWQAWLSEVSEKPMLEEEER